MERVRDQRKPFSITGWFKESNLEHDCNTAACFLGWCCRDKQFQSEGLTVINETPAIKLNNKPPLFGVQACAHFFDLSAYAARFLVMPNSYHYYFTTPHHVIEHIDKVLSGYGSGTGRALARSLTPRLSGRKNYVQGTKHMTPQIETATLIRAYAQDQVVESLGEMEARAKRLRAVSATLCAVSATLRAIVETDASEAEACCHMGRALLCLIGSFADPPFRLGGALCDSRLLEIARRLGMDVPTQ